MPSARRTVYFNPDAKSWNSSEKIDSSDAQAFHKQLPGYQQTPLVSLKDIAKEIGVKNVYVKDESSRFGLPAFKILGASWGSYRAVIKQLGLSLDHTFDQAREAASASGLKLYAATDGNHGRAVARMGSILSVPAEIHIPKSLHHAAADLIAGEGADVVRSAGTYDESMAAANEAARNDPNGVLVQDFAFDGYEDVPEVSPRTRILAFTTLTDMLSSGLLMATRLCSSKWTNASRTST